MKWQPYRRMAQMLKQMTPPRCAHDECSRRYPILNGWIRRDEGLRTQDGAWLCSPRCFEQNMSRRLAQLRRSPASHRQPRMNRIPLGLLLHQRGVITAEQLNFALDRHRKMGIKLGECLRQEFSVSVEDIAAAIAAQWSCPRYPAADINPECLNLVPLRLIERYRIMPVRFVEPARRLYVACTDGIPYHVLYGMERMLELRAEPCIINDSVFTSHVRQFSSALSGNDIVMESVTSPAEMARMTRSYAQQLQASEVRFALCGSYVWVRVLGHRDRMNLLYHPSEQAAALNFLDFQPSAALGI